MIDQIDEIEKRMDKIADILAKNGADSCVARTFACVLPFVSALGQYESGEMTVEGLEKAYSITSETMLRDANKRRSEGFNA